MGTLNASDRLTAMERVKRDGKDDQRKIIEAMCTVNELLLDLPAVEANDKTVHTQVVRTALPHGSNRRYNAGVGTGASKTETVKDIVTMSAIYSAIDRDLANQASNKEEFLTQEAVSFIYGLAEDQALDMVYGNNAQSAGDINGFATRRAKLMEKLCLDFGGTTGNLTSLYLVGCGAGMVQMLYPKGSKGAGVNREDRGVIDWDEIDEKGKPTGRKYPAYVNYYSADYGIAVGNQKALIRIANIPPTADVNKLVEAVLAARRYIPRQAQTVALYANDDILAKFDKAAIEKNNVIYTAEDPWGKGITRIRDIRLRQVDAISAKEEKVVA